MKTLLGGENDFSITIRLNTFGQERYYELVNLICHISYATLRIGPTLSHVLCNVLDCL